MTEKTSNFKGWQRILLFILPYIFCAGIFQFLGMLVAEVDFTDSTHTKTTTQSLIIHIFDLVGTLLILWLFMRFVDKKPFIQLGFQTNNRLQEFAMGLLLGLLIMSLGYGILYAVNELVFLNFNIDFKELLLSVFFFLIIAVVEESIFRGYIQRNLMLSFNKYVALLISAVIFSLAHGFNPNVSALGLLNIFLAGILLGISYTYTKNLWFPIALHWSWNLFQGLYGFNVSGQNFYNLINFKIEEANKLNGGAFGFEGSYLSIIAQVIAIAAIFYYYQKNTKNNVAIQ
ncbi:type II CAAX endopeptidase family protein [Leeuwenhoekiella marinoflava]|uniref:CPBP family intramembrane glutamic endopeptidase n=1 Tax=Leeuwenhoekiella marinoflava TaxID=988 RepID=UPI00300210D9